MRTASAVVRARSFSGAARTLGISPAAVSKLVAQLEVRLGTRLFDRTTRHLAVTPEGSRLLERIDSPLRQIDDALSASHAEAGAGAGGVVKVSVPAPFARLAIIPALPAFHDRHPDIGLDLRLENRRVNLVAEGYDCAIGADLAPDSTLVARTLATLRPVLCASPEYLAARGTPRSVDDLAHHRCIGLRSDSSGQVRPWRFGARAKTIELRPAGALRLTDPESVAAAAVAGCGIALVGVHHVADAILDGRLRRLLTDLQTLPFQLVVYYPKHRLLPARTRTFVDHVLRTAPASRILRSCLEVSGQPGG